MIARELLVVFVSAALAVCGCRGLDASDKNDCASDGDCLNGFICIDDLCVAGVCREDRDCALEKKCVEHECIDKVACLSSLDCQEPTPICDQVSSSCVRCNNNDHCERGNICVDFECLSGCLSVRDCPQDLLCNPEAGLHGECVECLNDNNCPEGYVCKDGDCVVYCTQDAQCPSSRYCHIDSGSCVECLNNDHCNLEFLCKEQACVPGCESDRDCRLSKVCDSAASSFGECVDCLVDGDCSSGYACDLAANVCVKHCQTNDDCYPLKCEPSSGLCVECLVKTDCQQSNLCVDFECIYGCESDQDCPQDMLCDPQYSEHGGCGECINDSDCPGDQSCVNLGCTTDCSLYECPPEKPNCNPNNNSCVECYLPNHCQEGFTCVVLTGFCVEGPQSQCVNHSECAEDEKCTDEMGLNFSCLTGQVLCECRKLCDIQEPCLDETKKCTFSVNGVCVPNWEVCNAETDCREPEPLCHAGSCVECITDADCAGEQQHICVAGDCVRGCRSDADCEEQLHCNLEYGDHGDCFECVNDEHCAGEFATCDTRYGTCIWCTQDADCLLQEQCNTFFNVCQPDFYGTPCDHDYYCASHQLCTDINGSDEYCWYHYVACNCRRVCDTHDDCPADNPRCAGVSGPDVCLPP
ncbi:MAG: hypothetical protein JRJ87_11140 [Deltaproteobacteria bacterium]|nr:hypothetical protein [Deltaproteobacteria bacterium]